MGKRIYCGNLSFQSSEDDIRALFSAHGEVTNIHVVMDRETGRPRGFAFVEVANATHATGAIEQLNGANVDGRTLTVNEAREREGSSRGGGGHRNRY